MGQVYGYVSENTPVSSCERFFIMKVCIVQPAYSADYSLSDAYFSETLSYFDACDESMDIIVFPEDSDQPCFCKTKEENDKAVAKYNGILLKKASETAKRCNAMVFVNARFPVGEKFRNTTYAFDRNGKAVGTYDKQHLVASESNVMKLDDDYSFSPTFPTIITIEGIRFAFLTCYDFYFYENYSNIARFYPDVIIGCSHQRSDPQHVLETMGAHLAYNTNAYVLRASVSMGKDSDIGGGSMIVSPDGRIVLNMKSRVGAECAEIDIAKKFYKPCGYGNPPGSHFDYCEIGRRPYKYRPCGPFIARNDDKTAYPRSSAPDGFYGIAPKGSVFAVGAAIAAECDEVMLSVYAARDRKAVICADENLAVPSGRIEEHTAKELSELDFGKGFGEEFSGLSIATLEDIFRKYTDHVLFTLYLKNTDGAAFDKETLTDILRLILLYDAKKYVRFAADNEETLLLLEKEAAAFPRAFVSDEPFDSLLSLAEKHGCDRIYTRTVPTEAEIKKAHEKGLRAGLFADQAEASEKALQNGTDILVSDRCRSVTRAVRHYRNRH